MTGLVKAGGGARDSAGTVKAGEGLVTGLVK